MHARACVCLWVCAVLLRRLWASDAQVDSQMHACSLTHRCMRAASLAVPSQLLLQSLCGAGPSNFTCHLPCVSAGPSALCFRQPSGHASQVAALHVPAPGARASRASCVPAYVVASKELFISRIACLCRKCLQLLFLCLRGWSSPPHTPESSHLVPPEAHV